MRPVADPGLGRRSLLATLAAGVTGTLAGCESGEETPSLSPAPVPDPEAARVDGTLLLHSDADGRSPEGRALTSLGSAFGADRESVSVRVRRRPPASTPTDSAVVRYGPLGATLADRVDTLRSLERVWDPRREHVPDPVAGASALDRRFVAVPQVVHRVNTLFYNPDVLDSAGVTPETYTTVATLAASPGGLAEEVETLFTQPLRDWRDLLALWESALCSRLLNQGQFAQLRTGATDPLGLLLRRSLRDLDAALSLIPAADHEADPTALLDGVVDGRVGFVRQPTWLARHLLAREDATYGENWAVTPMFAGPRTVVFASEGFSVPRSEASPLLADSFLRFALAPQRQRRFAGTVGASPARTDVAVDGHPFVVETARAYREATIHAPSIAHGRAVRPSVGADAATTLSTFVSERDVEAASEALNGDFSAARLL